MFIINFLAFVFITLPILTGCIVCFVAAVMWAIRSIKQGI